MRRAGTILLTIALILLAVATPAHALYGPLGGGLGAEVVSVDNASDEQGNAPASDAVISADGRYVVFQTRATNFFEDDGVPGGDPEPAGLTREGGIFRCDRLTGQIQLVADGSAYRAEGPEAGKLAFRGAQSPSVSADGRYVVFSSAQQLVPQAPAGRVEVYVRDMDVPLAADRSASGAYRLVSAKSGGEEPASFGPSKFPTPGEEPGAEAWSHSSLSADGRYVVFRTGEVESDLPGHESVDVGPEQLFVRDLQTDTTTLVSVEAGTGAPAGGAMGPAAISADGSTVSWVAKNAPVQTQFLSGESLSTAEPYYLWRRWQEPSGRTRRVTGIADPEDPECHEGEITQNSLATGPCYGPLSDPESYLASIASSAPALSADGYTVAFLAGAALRPNITKSSGLDVFLTSMRPGVTRKAGTRELTLAVKSDNPGSTPSIETIALSPDGSTIAFSSLRNYFVLPEPAPIGTFRPYPTASELYVIHLPANTLERAVVGYSGADPTGSIVGTPSLTQDGSMISFASSASNLIYGDANGFTDAFTATLQAPAGTAPPSGGVNAVPGGFSLEGEEGGPSPELRVHVRRGRDGSVVLLVEAPAAGRLTARARGRIAHVRRRGRASGARVLLASATQDAHAQGVVRLSLRLRRRYAKLLSRDGREAALVTVRFTPSKRGEALSQQTGVTFVRSQGRARHR